MKRKSVISLVLVGLLACLVGCNSNPVAATSGSDTLLGYSQSGRLAEENAVDILWVIDNSGSMGDEQVALINEFQRFVILLSNGGIDFQMAVTTTDTRPGFDGELNDVPRPVPGNLAWMAFAKDISTGEYRNTPGAWSVAAADSFFKTAKAAWKCSDGSETAPSDDELDNWVKKAVADAVGKESIKFDKKTFPSRYRPLKKIIKSSEYNLENAAGRKELVRDFSCMAMVGTEGNGIEKGIQGMLSATAPNKNPDLIRELAKFAVIFVSDENDCTHFANNGKDFNENACGTKVCNLFNADGIPDNPLMSVEEAKSRLMRNLKEAKKTDSEPDEKNVIVAAITGTPDQEVMGNAKIGFTKELAEIQSSFMNGQNPQQSGSGSDACVGVPYADLNPSVATPGKYGPMSNTCLRINNQTGNSATSGDRYNRFADLFTHHFPEKGKGEKGGEGVICFGSFGRAIDLIGALFQDASSGCITQKLLGADECSSAGTSCGVEGQGGECTALLDGSGAPSTTGQYYCSSAVQVVLVSPNPLSEKVVRDYCQDGVAGNVSGMSNACVFARSKYDFVECPLKVKGLKFKIKNLEQVKQDLVGVDVKVFYTAYAPEDEEVDATNTNQTQK